MDFGNALHLAMSAKDIGFKSLDEAIAKADKALEAYLEVSVLSS